MTGTRPKRQSGAGYGSMPTKRLVLYVGAVRCTKSPTRGVLKPIGADYIGGPVGRSPEAGKQ